MCNEIFEPSGLSDKDLLDAFLPENASKQLLREYPTAYDIVLHAPQSELEQTRGVGRTRAKRLLCLREIVRRMELRSKQSVTVIHGPEDVASYFAFLKEAEQEEFWLLMLNTKNHIIGSKMISKGSISASVVHPRELFHEAVKHLAASIIVVHNHPSGEAEPSREDIAVTERLVKASKIMDIPLLDHVIVARYGFKSMKEQGTVTF